MAKPDLVVCSGYNWDGQTNVPVDFQTGTDHMAAGAYHTCMSKQAKLLCWGNNNEGQISVPDNLSTGVDLLAAGGKTSCA